MAIGYRLFLALAAEAGGDARMTLPNDVTVMMAGLGAR
jgi:hypothetical protein